MSRIALITGATAGIGEACAHKFAENGWDLILTGRRAERLDVLAEFLRTRDGIRVHTLSFDVRDRAAVQAAVAEIPEAFRPVHLLINNAGLALGKSGVQDGDPDDWDTMIDTNVKGLLYMTKAVVPEMIGQKQGHVINIGSLAGREVYPGGNVYCATKHAVEALSRAMRIDFLEAGIKVTSISPGLVETEFSVVRFKGDQNKADGVYFGFEPLYAPDIAESVFWAASQPAHVCINDIFLTCTAQATSTIVHKEA